MLWYKLVQVGMPVLYDIPTHTDLSRWSGFSGYRFIPSYAMVQTSSYSFDDRTGEEDSRTCGCGTDYGEEDSCLPRCVKVSILKVGQRQESGEATGSGAVTGSKFLGVSRSTSESAPKRRILCALRESRDSDACGPWTRRAAGAGRPARTLQAGVWY